MEGKKKVVGVKQTLKTIKSGMANKVYVAKDADSKVISPVVEAARENELEVIYFDSMDELGNFCSIDVGAATACDVK